MIFSILTLFPEMFQGPFDYSIIKKAQTKNLIKINLVNIRDFALDKYKTVDDRPFGGGAGMIIKVDVIDRALMATKKLWPHLKTRILVMDPKGKIFSQKKAQTYADYEHLIIICGHYEGIDTRVNYLADDSVSVGKFITTGGELPAMIIVDSIGRLVPGVLKSVALKTESFNTESLEAPQYTRPQKYLKMKVPPVLLSGNHQKISAWKKKHTLNLGHK